MLNDTINTTKCTLTFKHKMELFKFRLQTKIKCMRGGY